MGSVEPTSLPPSRLLRVNRILLPMWLLSAAAWIVFWLVGGWLVGVFAGILTLNPVGMNLLALRRNAQERQS